MTGDIDILLVEDDVEEAGRLSALLVEAGGCRVEVASQAERACELLGLDDGGPPARTFAAVILDIGLPDGDGIELCRRIRAREALQHLAVIMVTAHGDDEALEAAFAAGASDYLRKPVRARELLARVQVALRRQGEIADHLERETRLAGLAQRLSRNNKELIKVSTVDALTGVANRRQFNAVYRLEWRRCSRNRKPMAIALADVDWFHAYNEHHGHLAGDECLRRIAAALSDVGRRPPDLLARYGGEEFVYVLGDTDADGARVVAERMREAVAALDLRHSGAVTGQVTVSVGFASTVPRPDVSPDMLLAAADEALLEAKRLGRNRVRQADQAPEEVMVEIDALVMRRVPTFLQNRRADVRALIEYARDGAFDGAALLGHRLKGTGPSFGFGQLGTIGARIEQAALVRDPDAIRRCAAELAAYLDAVKVVPRVSS